MQRPYGIVYKRSFKQNRLIRAGSTSSSLKAPMDPLETSSSAPATATHRVMALHAASLPAISTHTARQQRLAVDERLSALLKHVFGLTDWSATSQTSYRSIDAHRAARVHLRWGMHTAAIIVDAGQHRGLASVLGDYSNTAQDPAHEPAQATLRAAVSAILLSPLSRAFDALGFPGVELVAIDNARIAPAAQPDYCVIAFQRGAQRFDAVVEHIDDAWLDALETLVRQQRTPLASHISEISVPGRLHIGERNISLSALNSLRVGDVILRVISDDVRRFLSKASTSVRLPVVWGQHGARRLHTLAEVQHHAFTLIQEPSMSHDTQYSAPMNDTLDNPIEISELDLPLKLEIDTVSLPVAQLSALRAGYVLELPTALPDARIRLVSYGQTIGFGELVTVGDHLGVRLVQLSHLSHLSQSHGSV